MLELRNISKRFGSVLANDRVSLRVDQGSIHAIVGENGAGKSTAMRIAYGFYTADEGDVVVDGRPRRIGSPAAAIALGIGMVHQHFMLVDTMTVAENIVLGAEPGSAASLDLARAVERIRDLSKAFGLAVDPDATIASLSVGQQQRVELLKALYRDARLLILDEPTAVLTPQEVAELFTILRRMRAQGKTVVIITHKLAEVLALSDDVTVMRDGRVVGRVRTSETSAAELARLMVGRDVLLRVEKSRAKPGPPVLDVRDLRVTSQERTDCVSGVSLTVHAGEIVGIAGVEGNGQAELMEALAGLVDPSRVSGAMTLRGQSLIELDARARREIGVAHVPEDRQRRGLLLDFGVDENAILGVHYRPPITMYAGQAVFNRREIARRAKDIITRFDVRPPDAHLPARALSGGNQQKLVIGRELELAPGLLLVSQPTRGVDIGAIEFIHGQLIALRDAGCALLLVTAELEEAMSLSDRLLIMHAGRIVGEVDPAAVSPDHIGLLMTRGHA